MFVLFALPWKMSARCPVVRNISAFHWASSIGGTTMSVCGRKLVRHTPIIMMVLPNPISSQMKPPLTGRGLERPEAEGDGERCSIGCSRVATSGSGRSSLLTHQMMPSSWCCLRSILALPMNQLYFSTISLLSMITITITLYV